MSVTPVKLQCVPTHVFDGGWIDPIGYHRLGQDTATGHFVDASCAGTMHPKLPRDEDRHVAVFPLDSECGAIFGGTDVGRSDFGGGHESFGRAEFYPMGC